MKKYLNRYTVSAALVLLLVFAGGAATVVQNSGALAALFAGEQTVPQRIDAAEEVYNNTLAFKEQYLSLWGRVQFDPFPAAGRTFEDAEYGYLIEDGHGSFLFPYSSVGAEALAAYAGQTRALSEAAAACGTPFVYVQAPNKNISGYTTLPSGAANEANDDADRFLALLADAGVATLDLRPSLFADPDPDTLFFRTDHHWTTRAAFAAYREVVDYLNGSLGMGLDPDGVFRDEASWDAREYPQCFLGSLGRRVGQEVAGLDDYTFLSPRFDTAYTLRDPLSATPDVPLFAGGFLTAIAKEGILNSASVEDNRHASYFEWDYGDLVIDNGLQPNGKRILLVKDSYSLPLAAFLSTCVSRLELLDMREPRADVLARLREGGFDAVIVLYNAEIFGSDAMFAFDR